jgi:hypothetical protein
MATKRKRKATPAEQRHVISVEPRDSSDTPDDGIARMLTRPETQAAGTMQVWEHNYEVNALARELTEQIAAASRGDLSRTEGMLMSQAHTLDAIFNNLARWARLNFDAGYLEAGDRLLRLALKSQSQCRTTGETLAEIKNPMAGAYVRQANIAAGDQQVNNGTPAPGSRAGKTENPQIELSRGCYELLPDTRASQAESCIDTRVEAVGEVHRAKILRGQGQGGAERLPRRNATIAARAAAGAARAGKGSAADGGMTATTQTPPCRSTPKARPKAPARR